MENKKKGKVREEFLIFHLENDGIRNKFLVSSWKTRREMVSAMDLLSLRGK